MHRGLLWIVDGGLLADTLDGDGGVIDEGTWVIEDRTTKALKTRAGLPVRLTTVRTPGEHGLIMAQRAECTAVVARRRTAEVARERRCLMPLRRWSPPSGRSAVLRRSGPGPPSA